MRKTIVLMLAAGVVAAISCQRQPASQTRQGGEAAVTRNPAVHAIALPHYAPNLPAGTGREAFASACLTCHSTRYIGMQPPLTAAKWEENVRKMIKVYNAPITEEQVPQVVQYLMATKEGGTPGAWNSLAAITVTDAPAPLFTPAQDPAAHARDIDRGKSLYATNCASCHGATGLGDGLSAAPLLPRPSDLTAARYSVQALSNSLYYGVPAAAMPSFAALPAADLRALVAYTQSLSTSNLPAPIATAEAKSLYATNCFSCHGPDGRGDGPAAPPMPRPPANFHLKQPSQASALHVITEGIPGSTMPRWKEKLTDPQRQLLADYVRSLYDGEH
jgi:cbb3-type cytochrome c oxidase subunit III